MAPSLRGEMEVIGRLPVGVHRETGLLLVLRKIVCSVAVGLDHGPRCRVGELPRVCGTGLLAPRSVDETCDIVATAHTDYGVTRGTELLAPRSVDETCDIVATAHADYGVTRGTGLLAPRSGVTRGQRLAEDLAAGGEPPLPSVLAHVLLLRDRMNDD